MLGSLADLLRLLALPIFGWAAYRDLRTRRVPNRTWLPLVGVGALALALDAWVLWTGGPTEPQFLTRVGLSVGLLVPFGFLFWQLGGFGGADAKAVAALALVFPVAPTDALALVDVTLPLADSRALGVFSLTILTNAALLGGTYPLWLAARNALDGRVSLSMAIGRPVATRRVPRTHGRLLGRANGLDGGLDLDAVRMYLRWRDATLPALRADPAAARDPASLPAEPSAPGDGSIADTGTITDDTTTGDGDLTPMASTTTARPADDTDPIGITDTTDTPYASDTPDPADLPDDSGATDTDDPWGASAFLDDAGGAYGATPARLRAGLDALMTREQVWITPGVPFVVFLFLGLCIALVYGDLLVAAMAWLGVF